MTWTSDAMLASYSNAMPESYQADMDAAVTQDAMRITADHWTDVMGSPVEIEFAKVNGQPEYYGPDHYRVYLKVGRYMYGTFESLTELENFLERMNP